MGKQTKPIGGKRICRRMPPKNMYIASKRKFAARRLYFEKTLINKN